MSVNKTLKPRNGKAEASKLEQKGHTAKESQRKFNPIPRGAPLPKSRHYQSSLEKLPQPMALLNSGNQKQKSLKHLLSKQSHSSQESTELTLPIQTHMS